MINQTLAIIKPDSVRKKLVNKIRRRLIDGGLQIKRQKVLHLTEFQTKQLYHRHLHRPYYRKLEKFMTSGVSVVMLLEGENAVEKWRKIMLEIRRDFAASQTENCVHGADSATSAAEEIRLFFPENF